MNRILYLVLIIQMSSGCDIRPVANMSFVKEPVVSAHSIEIETNVAFINFESALCLTTDESDFIRQGPCRNETKQRYVIKKLSSENYQITQDNGQLCVTLTNLKGKLGENWARYKMESCDKNRPEQIFWFPAAKNDLLYFKIASANETGKCVDAEFMNGKFSGNLVYQWQCQDNRRSQEFYAYKIPTESRKFNKKVWMYWNTGESEMPNFHKANLEIWRKKLDSEWEIIVLDNVPKSKNYIGKYFDLNIIPSEDFLKTKIGEGEANGKLKSYIVFSDFVRLAVLYTQGGIYADASTMLHRDLSEFVDVLENVADFTIGGYVSPHQALHYLRYADSLENFFLASLPKTEFVEKWLGNFKNYWEQKQKYMDIQDHPMYSGEKGFFDDFRKPYGELRNYLNQHIALRYTLKKNSHLVDQVFIRGLRGRDSNGPFSLLEAVDWEDEVLLSLGPNKIEEIAYSLYGTNISKFPSENTRSFKDKPIDFFMDKSNIFGRLNLGPK